MIDKEIPASELASKLGITTEEAKRLKDSKEAFERKANYESS